MGKYQCAVFDYGDKYDWIKLNKWQVIERTIILYVFCELMYCFLVQHQIQALENIQFNSKVDPNPSQYPNSTPFQIQ